MRIAALGAAGICICLGAVSVSAPAGAQLNQFEIREPKVEAGEVELEYLGDYHFGQPRRRFFEESPGSFEFDANEFARQRHTFGLSYGFTRWLSLQLAVEAEEERRDDPETMAEARSFGPLKVTEVEIEGTIVLVPARKDGWGLAALFEHNISIDRREADQL